MIYIIVFVIILAVFLIYEFAYKNEHFTNEHFTNDEAIKNVASLYNTEKITIGELAATKSISSPTIDGLNKQIADLKTTIDTLKTTLENTIQTQIQTKIDAMQKNLDGFKAGNFEICDTKHRKCIIAGDNYDGDVYHQDVRGRPNGRWTLKQV